MRAALAAARGAPSDSAGVQESYATWPPRSWERVMRWRTRDATVVTAYGPAAAATDSALVFSFAHLPLSRLGRDFDEQEADPDRDVYDRDAWWVGEDAALTMSTLDRAVALAELPRELSAPLRRLARWGADSATEGRVAHVRVDTLVVPPLERWLAAAEDLPAGRRAAALLVADRTLAAAAPSVASDTPADDSATAGAIAKLGARYVYSPLGASWEYDGNWLREARALDRDGPVGELALLVQIESGFLRPMCGGSDSTGESFRTVIAQGERYLSEGRHEPSRLALVHLAVADAYRDVVALAAGASADYADPARYAREAPAARRKAIAHYRRYLALSRATGRADTPRARRAWREAWRLLAGLPPADLRFFCVYD